MNSLFRQFAGLIGAAVAAACCLGIPAVLAALGAIGLGFVVHDAYLFPLFVGFAGFSLWVLYRSAKAHGQMLPFWLSLSGATLGATGLWLLVTGLFPQPWSIYTGLMALVAGSVWDFVNGRRANQAPGRPATGEAAPLSIERRAMTGSALAIAAAGAFYAMYKSVDALVPAAEADEIACWGINSCKGTSACTTAFNACTGQNECKGRGYLYATERECYARGGEPLKGSAADPAGR
jgi:mercuric ion transport protein